MMEVKKFMKSMAIAVSDKLHEFVGRGGWAVITLIAILGILAAIVSHYWKLGFNWQAFLCFEIPLYAFCGWALYNAYRMFKRIK